jgi:hypothetical protein
MNLVKLDVRGQKITDLDHKVSWMVKHYGATIQELLDMYGAQDMGVFLANELAKQKQAQG